MNTSTTQTPAPRLLLTVEEAAQVLAVGRTTVFHLIRTGQLATVQIGRLRRVPMDALHAFARELQE
ncbi:MAG: helix-turn-helix domain-containing protein [Pseudonocardiales bacterium]|nr:helix-turn-helix domain-containing protein [Pseudonocardiales bacterium]